MKLRTQVRDALYLNWAVPRAALPPPPEPLRYQVREAGGREWAFASAVLFQHRAVEVPGIPFLRLSYPQLNLRLYTLDGDGVPSVLFREMLLPLWVKPAVLWVAGPPVSAARFDLPHPSDDPGGDGWRWRVERRGRLEVSARRGAPRVGAGPSLGDWEETVRFFRDRPRGYLEAGHRLRRIETEHPRVEVWPLTAEVVDHSLLARLLPLDGGGPGGGWPPLHSAWLCPEIPFVFELHLVHPVEMEPSLPQAASTRSCARAPHRPAGGRRRAVS